MRDLTADEAAPDGETPDFDAWAAPEELFDGESIKERMLDVVLQLRSPTKVATIGDRVDCDTETAREYLEWFDELGLVRKQPGRPTRYERNASFLRWRRIDHIRRQYSEAEIVEELQATLEAIEAFQDRFDADTPGDVSLVDVSTDTGTDTTVADAWEVLSEWQTLERRAALLDAAQGDADAPRTAARSDA